MRLATKSATPVAALMSAPHRFKVGLDSGGCCNGCAVLDDRVRGGIHLSLCCMLSQSSLCTAAVQVIILIGGGLVDRLGIEKVGVWSTHNHSSSVQPGAALNYL